MKKNRLFAIVLILSMMSGILLSGCAKKSENLEEFLQKDSESLSTIDETAKAYNMDVDIAGNEIILTYDLANVEGTQEDMIKDPAVLEAFEKMLDESSSVFQEQVKDLESKAGFSGIKMTVNFTYGDETLVTKTYTAD